MKHLFTLFFSLCSLFSFSQISFTADTAELLLEPGTSKKAYIDVTVKGAPVDLTWYRLNSDLNTNWSVLQFCECSLCYDFTAGIRDSASCTDFTGGGIGWYLEADPGSEEANSGLWQIAVHDKTNDVWDTLTWVVSAPNSINNLPNENADLQVIYGTGSSISLSWAGEKATEVQVFSLTGVLVHSGVIQPGMNELNLSRAEKGMYILKQGNENVSRFFVQ